MSVALVIQHAKRMPRSILSSVARRVSTPYFFPTLSFKQRDFRIKVNDPMMCVSILSTTFACDISHSKNTSARYYHKCTYVFMYRTRYSCQILTRLEFS